VQQLIALPVELVACRCYHVGVLDLELD
jgi:hypothetical protein